MFPVNYKSEWGSGIATKAHFVLLLQQRCTYFFYYIHIYTYTHVFTCVGVYTYIFCRYMEDKSEHHTVGLLCNGNAQKTKLVADLKTQEMKKYHSHCLNSSSLCALKLKWKAPSEPPITS